MPDQQRRNPRLELYRDTAEPSEIRWRLFAKNGIQVLPQQGHRDATDATRAIGDVMDAFHQLAVAAILGNRPAIYWDIEDQDRPPALGPDPDFEPDPDINEVP